MYTTLNKIREKRPCSDGWEKLLRHLGKTHADDEPLNIATVLDSNGLDDALWCLRAVDGSDCEIRLFSIWCAREVQHLMTDIRSVNALDVAERFANGLESTEQFAEARMAAWAAWGVAGDAAEAAREAAEVAEATARAARAAWAAGEAAGEAAWEAAGAARAAGCAATRDAARATQSAKLREICQLTAAPVPTTQPHYESSSPVAVSEGGLTA